MALLSRHIVTSHTTAAPVLVQGTTGTKFPIIVGSLQDPLPIILQNLDAAINIFIGGPDVSSSNGYALAPGASLPMQLFGESEIPYIVAASGTPTLAVLCGRQ